MLVNVHSSAFRVKLTCIVIFHKITETRHSLMWSLSASVRRLKWDKLHDVYLFKSESQFHVGLLQICNNHDDNMVSDHLATSGLMGKNAYSLTSYNWLLQVDSNHWENDC